MSESKVSDSVRDMPCDDTLPPCNPQDIPLPDEAIEPKGEQDEWADFSGVGAAALKDDQSSSEDVEPVPSPGSTSPQKLIPTPCPSTTSTNSSQDVDVSAAALQDNHSSSSEEDVEPTPSSGVDAAALKDNHSSSEDVEPVPSPGSTSPQKPTPAPCPSTNNSQNVNKERRQHLGHRFTDQDAAALELGRALILAQVPTIREECRRRQEIGNALGETIRQLEDLRHWLSQLAPRARVLVLAVRDVVEESPEQDKEFTLEECQYVARMVTKLDTRLQKFFEDED